MKSTKKMLFVTLLFVCMALVMTGCGAEIFTQMTINSDFSGERVIDVKISSEDLADEVNGGIEALKAVADANLPPEMTVVSSGDESGSTLTFTLSFSSLEDYKTKVESLLTKGNVDLVPEITYENLDNVFKKSIVFEENFDSSDLIRWYLNAVEAAGIVNHTDTSDWFEMSDTNLTVDNTEFENYGSSYDVEERDLACLNSIYVDTVLNADGSMERTFTFEAEAEIVEKLANKGVTLADYLEELVPAGGSFKDLNQASDEVLEDGVAEESDDSVSRYAITVSSASSEEIAQMTDAILQSTNLFSVGMELDPEKLGVANISVQEKLDGSFYLDYEYRNSLYSNITLFGESERTDSGEGNFDGTKLDYRPAYDEEYSFAFDWKINYSSVKIDVDVESAEDATVKLVFNAQKNLKKEIKDASLEAVKALVGKKGEAKKDGDTLTVTFTGTVAKINKNVSDFIQSASEDGYGNFSLSFKEGETASKFTTSYFVQVEYDLSPLIANSTVVLNKTKGALDTYYQGEFEPDKDGKMMAQANGSFSFTVVELSILAIILTAVFALLMIAGVILLLIKRKRIGELIRDCKEKCAAKKEARKAAAPAQPQQYAAPVQPAQPQQYAAPVQPVQPQQYAAPVQPAQPQQYAAPVQPAQPQQPAAPADQANEQNSGENTEVFL